MEKIFNTIKINDNIKNIKLDIGLSYSAPNSQIWLEREPDLMVIGFDPNPDSSSSILSDKEIEKKKEYHGEPIRKKYVNNRFFLFPIALSNVKTETELVFYKTEIDSGTSSLYEPNSKSFGKNDRILVPVFSLKHFFDIFPFDRFEYIDYIKIDAQGSDLDIIIGAGDYIRERVVYITAEPECLDYHGCNNNTVENIDNYLKSQGFERIQHPNTTDPTFINSKFLHLRDSIFIYQV